MVSALTATRGDWYVVPLTRYEADEYDMLIDSPLLEDQPTVRVRIICVYTNAASHLQEHYKWRNIPKCFAALHSVSTLARDESEDVARFISSFTACELETHDTYYVGTLSKYILEFRDGQLVSCAPLPYVPVSM